MLAFLAWHRPEPGVERDVYERALERFHRSLAHRPPSGFRGSASARIEQVPWLDGAVYEDWYLVEDWAALGVLEEAAVAHGHATAHDAAAALTGMETAAVYRLIEGSADPGRALAATWVSAARGHERSALAQLLGDGIDPECDGLWQRCLVLGPAPEYCLLADEAPAGVAPGRLPRGWAATTLGREVLWRN
ncbi:MAG TPA: hypothetical protein VK765_05085 [Solirubrobacteraceae bacterium]|nr:hypothetical protein [Solirubrobacteraceae bacterium]